MMDYQFTTIKNMQIVVVKVMGGLASQLHKYAIGRTVADYYGCDLMLDLSWFENTSNEDTKRDFLLDKFNVRYVVENRKTIQKLKPGFFRRALKYFVRKAKILSSKFGTNSEFFITQRVEISKINLPVYMEGEWFGEEFINKNRENLIKDFSMKGTLNSNSILSLSKIKMVESVSLHVRRGDYITNRNASNFHLSIPLDYYKVAISNTLKVLNNPVFFIFSDDIEWVKENFSSFKLNIEFMEENSAIDDLILMSNCKHHIIANSGFSWFAAWLSDGPKSTLIAPYTWVKDESTNNMIREDLILHKFQLV